MKRFAVFLGVLIVLASLVYGWRLYNKPHRNIAKEKADFIVEAAGFYQEFEQDQDLAHDRYDNRVIEINGTLQKISRTADGKAMLLLGDSGGYINCEMHEDYDALQGKVKDGQPVSLKGLYIGYDDLLGEVQLKECQLIE